MLFTDYSGNLRDDENEIAEKIKLKIEEDFGKKYSEKVIAKKKNRILTTVGIFCVICVLAIIGINCYIVTHIPSQAEIPDSVYSSTLLSDGLAIISIAISVWAGLNIANAVERKELDATDAKIKRADKKIKQLDEENQKLEKDSENLKAIVNPLLESTKSVQHSLSFMFENELIKTIKDSSTLFFYNKFTSLSEEEKEKTYSKYYPDIVIVEQTFVRLYDTHSSKQSKDILLEKFADKGIQNIEALLDNWGSEVPDLIIHYLKYRKAEFLYYSGYITANPQKYYDSFIGAAEIYIKLQSEFNAWTPTYTPKAKVPDNIKDGYDKTLSTYMANSIGDAYSRFILYAKPSKSVVTKDGTLLTTEKIIEIGKKGVFFCSCAAKWANPKKNQEVYYRNLGCAYERLEKHENHIGKYHNEIIFNYSRAFEEIINYDTYSYRIQSVYYTLIQYLKKYLDKTLGIDKIFRNIKCFENAINSCKALSEEEVQYLNKLYFITNFAKTDNHRHSIQYCVNGLTLAVIIYFKLKNDPLITTVSHSEILECIQKMEENITILKAMGKDSDDYFKDLCNRYTIIKTFIEKQTKDSESMTVA
ncbi:MAG: hypothetical protein IJD68_05160 [Ruminococcus sp.]|nr:hypothetical protein [Ruminococcus sp.]